MANMRFSINPSAYSFIAESGTGTVNSAYPSTFISDLTRPRRAYRTLDTSVGFKVVLNLGAIVTVTAFSVENANFATIKIEGSDDASTWANAQTFNIAVDADDARRKVICVPSPAFTNKHVRISSNVDGLPVTGETFWKIGCFGVWTQPFTILNKNFSTPYEKSIEDDSTEVTFDGGGVEINAPQIPKIRFSLQSRVLKTNTTALNEFKSMATYSRAKVMLLYENEADLVKMYHVRRDGNFRITRTNDSTLALSGLQLTEVS